MLFFFLLAFPVAVWAQSTDIEIEPVRTSITVREAVEAESSGYVTAVDAESLDSRPGVNIDDRLRDIPGFSLFRRSSSLVAHPTTQGVSLRGIGSSAAGRTLVLYDGFPVNDPFGVKGLSEHDQETRRVHHRTSTRGIRGLEDCQRDMTGFPARTRRSCGCSLALILGSVLRSRRAVWMPSSITG